MGRRSVRLAAGAERERNEYLTQHWGLIKSAGNWAAERCDTADADDLIQEVAIAAVRRYQSLRSFVAGRPPRLSEGEAVARWLWSAARRIAHWQRTGRPSRFDRLRVELDLETQPCHRY